MCLSSAHCVDLKNGCPLTSLAPALDPSRRFSSLTSSLRMRDLQLLFSSVNEVYKMETKVQTDFDIVGTPACSGKLTSSRRMLANVAFLFLPLNGVVPKSISYTRIPSVHQSTALVWPHPLITSGAMYSSVPTKELVRKLAIQDLVSTIGSEDCDAPERETIMVGTPPGSDCFDKSKSDNMMCPDW